MVPKTDKDGEVKYRIVGDYRALNAITKRDSYPIPHIHSFSSKLAGMHYFSKIDLMSAYHQIPMSPDDIPKTAVITPFGLFEYVSMPFGLRNASCTFQRFMDNIFRHIPNVSVYLDDILICTKAQEEHNKTFPSPRICTNKPIPTKTLNTESDISKLSDNTSDPSLKDTSILPRSRRNRRITFNRYDDYYYL